MLVNWQDVAQRLLVAKATIGEIRRARRRLHRRAALGRPPPRRAAGPPLRPACDADLGDARCGVDLAAHRATGTVAATDGRAALVAAGLAAVAGRALRRPGGWPGTSGANAGARVEVKRHAARRPARCSSSGARRPRRSRAGDALRRDGRLRQALRDLPRPLRQQAPLPRLPAHSRQRPRRCAYAQAGRPATTAGASMPMTARRRVGRPRRGAGSARPIATAARCGASAATASASSSASCARRSSGRRAAGRCRPIRPDWAEAARARAAARRRSRGAPSLAPRAGPARARAAAATSLLLRWRDGRPASHLAHRRPARARSSMPMRRRASPRSRWTAAWRGASPASSRFPEDRLMATLVLQTVGTVVGSIFGPAGAAIGSALGGLAGAAIDGAFLGQDGQAQRPAPRQSPGHVLDRGRADPAPLRTARARRPGDLGDGAARSVADAARPAPRAPSRAVEEFSYFANFAVGLCEGPIGQRPPRLGGWPRARPAQARRCASIAATRRRRPIR